MHLVSIIIPCYNQAVYLSEALDSVLAQTYSDWECVVINDDSPDNTEEIAKKYVESDTRFKYIFQENSGPSAARNNGIKNSHGEYLLPLDADDLIAPTYLEKAVDHFSHFPETKLVYCKAEKFGKENGVWNLPEYDYESFIWNNCIFCTAMFRRSDYDKTGGYNENMVHGNEDWDFWLSLIKKEDIVHRIEEILFFYRVKSFSRTVDLEESYLQKTLIQMGNNHPEVYGQYKEGIIQFRNDLMENIDYLRKSIDSLRSSRAYRLGKTLLKPFSILKK